MRSATMNKAPRPAIIDVEASGFGKTSYPIEVGVVLPGGQRFCSLINPAESWSHWDPEAEALHGISRELLAKKGADVTEVAGELNRFLEGYTVYSDGWVVDSPWIRELYYRAGIPQHFRLSALEMILSSAQMEIWDETKKNVVLELQDFHRHRASSDALMIQETYCRTLQAADMARAEKQSNSSVNIGN